MKRAGDRFGRLFFYDTFEQRSQPLTHECSSVGARPFSAAPLNSIPDDFKACQLRILRTDLCSTGAAEDGRAPTEEPSCVRGPGF